MQSFEKDPAIWKEAPLPGAPGNSVIAGHRDTHFRVLKDVLIGDEIRIDRANEARAHLSDRRCPHRFPQGYPSPSSAEGQTITLITCYPFYFLGPAPMRYVVRPRLTSR